MAIRELVTAFTFQTEMAGLKEYEGAVAKAGKATEKAFDTAKITAGFEKLQGVVFKLTNLMGLTFAIGAMSQLADKAMDYTKEIINGAKETNRLNAQIGMIVGNTTQAKEVQEKLYDLAQKTGTEYTDVVEMSKGILVAGKEQKISFEDSTNAVSNMVLALKTGKASAQDTAEAVGSLEMGLRMGKIGPRTIGRLINAPGLGQFLADQMGISIDQARARLKKMSVKDLIETLGKPSDTLNAKVAKLPFTISRAFAMIKNDLTEAAAAIMKLTVGFGGIGKMVWNAFSFAKSATLGFVNALGGLQSTVELVGYALAIALGPLLVRQIILATASLVEMAVASWAVWAPWLLIGVAIAAAALLLQDFMLWMQGGKNKTVLGDMLGPFDELKKTLEDMPIVKILTGIKDFFTGDFSKGFQEIKAGILSIHEPAQALWVTIGLIGGAFVLWQALEFTGIIGALGKLAGAFKSTKAEADATTTAIQRTQNATNAPGAPAGTPGAGPVAPGGRTPIKRSMLAIGVGLPLAVDATMLGQQAGVVPQGSPDFQKRLALAGTGGNLGAMIGAGIGAFFAGIGAVPGAAIGGAVGTVGGFVSPELQKAGSAIWNKPDWAPDWMNKGLLDTLAELAKKSGVQIQNTNPSADQPGVPSSGQQRPTLPWSSSSLTPQVSPFATGPQTVANTVNAGGIIQNNNITVTAQMDEAQVAAAVQKSVESKTPELLDSVSRRIKDALPLSERAAG